MPKEADTFKKWANKLYRPAEGLRAWKHSRTCKEGTSRSWMNINIQCIWPSRTFPYFMREATATYHQCWMKQDVLLCKASDAKRFEGPKHRKRKGGDRGWKKKKEFCESTHWEMWTLRKLPNFFQGRLPYRQIIIPPQLARKEKTFALEKLKDPEERSSNLNLYHISFISSVTQK